MSLANFTESLLKRDRLVVWVGLGLIIVVSWAYVIYLSLDMEHMAAMTDNDMGMMMAMPDVQPWGMVDYSLTFIMWSVMMFAMMTPSVAPMVLTYTAINRQRQADITPVSGTAFFYLGYLLVWIAFSALVALVQGGLHAATLLSPMMETTNPILGGSILVAAGIFQFTPLKHACLSQCRTPLGFFLTEWREGKWGALIMGVRHGAFCVGCCWLIMILLLVTGVMNLFWNVAMSVYVLGEKSLPGGDKISLGIGAVPIAWGMWMIAGAFL